MEEEKLKPCKICLLEIDTEKDDYLVLGQYDKGKFKSKGYFHQTCFKERFVMKNKLMGMAEKIVGKLNEVTA